MRFDKLTQTIAAGAVWRLGMAANDLQIVSSSAPLSITLYKGGAVIGAGSRVLAGDYFRGVDFDLVELASEVAQEVTILLSDGTSGSNRVVGEVSVINGEVSRVKSNTAFIRPMGVGAVAAQYPHTMIKNPVGSGKLYVVSKVSVVVGAVAVSSIYLLSWDSTLAPLATESASGFSKRFGGQYSSAVIGSENNAALLPGLHTVMIISGKQDETQEFKFAEPIILDEGYGLLLRGQAVGSSLTATYQWFEEDK